MISRRGLLSVPLLDSVANLVPARSGARPASATPVCENPAGAGGAGTRNAIWKSYYAGTRVWGYADRHSISPVGRFTIMLSTGPNVKSVTGRIEVQRIGHYREDGRKLVYADGTVRVAQNEVQMTAALLGAAWPRGRQIQTDGWESGYCTVDFIDDSDGQRGLDIQQPCYAQAVLD